MNDFTLLPALWQYYCGFAETGDGVSPGCPKFLTTKAPLELFEPVPGPPVGPERGYIRLPVTVIVRWNRDIFAGHPELLRGSKRPAGAEIYFRSLIKEYEPKVKLF
jgi:hypothetical protein